MPALRFVDTVAYNRPADQAALPPAAADADAADHTLVDYGGAPVAWQSSEPDLTKLHSDAAAGLAAAISVTAYPTPSQALPPRATTVGSLLDSGYSHPGAMFDTPGLAPTDVTMSGFTTAITAALAAAMPATCPFSPFPAIAATPNDTHHNSKASSASPGEGYLMPPHVHPDMAGAPWRPIPRPLDIHPLPVMPSFDELTGSGRISLVHSEPVSASAHSAGIVGFGLATRPPSSGNKDSSAMFPSLLYRICEDPLLRDVAFWDENSFVCIPDMERLRLKLNGLGMTANHTDSLQKNFNDYQFKRQTDQRRIRHTNERAIVKFSNDSFLPDREDLLVNVVRKSAIKKNQNGTRDRQAGQTATRRRARVPSIKQGNGGRGARQSASERTAPYARHPQSEHSPISGFPMPISPTTPFPGHPAPGSAGMHPLYTAGEMPGLMMPLGVPGLGFNIPHTVPLADRADAALMPATAAYSQAPLYIDHAPGLVVPGLMQHQPPMGLSGPFHGSYPATLPPRHHAHMHAHQHFSHYPQHEHSPQQVPMFTAGPDPQHGQVSFLPPLNHDQSQHQLQPHQYHVIASPGDLSSYAAPSNGVGGENHSL
ncbi:hypothetical protein H4R19_004618 [Coemansia spiralis]|nr:hypothetical protein H4R19_004618 [Coemansia spiralis]